MSNYNLKQISLFYLQIFFSFGLIITILISISLSYNEILKLDGKKPLYEPKLEEKILVFNRMLNFLIATSFVWLNVQNKKYSKKDRENIKYADLQIEASILSLISSLLVLYVTLDNINDLSSSNFDNPVL